MELLQELFRTAFITPSAIQSIVVIGVVSSLGLLLSKLHIGRLSLGVTFVFFVGIIFASLGISIDPTMLDFAMNFGLVLFIYALGLQVGPAFFPSLKRGGVVDNLLSTGMVAFSIILCLVFMYLADIPIHRVVGIMSGAVTNTPLLAAAQSSLAEVSPNHGDALTEMALACATTYPMGVVGVILALSLIMMVAPPAPKTASSRQHTAFLSEFQVANEAIFHRTIADLAKLIDAKFVISRIWRSGQVMHAYSDTALEQDDRLLVVSSEDDLPQLEVLFGRRLPKDWNQEDIDWNAVDKEFVSKRIVVSKSKHNGVKLGSLKLRNFYGINITRIDRAGIELLSSPDLRLQLGDRLTVVGEKSSVDAVSNELGDEVKELETPNLLSLFMGVVLGALIGMIPIYIPGISMPIKMGLAGGAIVLGILMGAFGPRFHVATYITNSAGLLIRQLGIVLYLGCLGLKSGAGLFDMVFSTTGLIWLSIGFAMTVLPCLLFGWISIGFYKRSVSATCGMICGSMANPMALEVLGKRFSDDEHTVSYATVYPLAMFIRIVTAQILILIFV